MRRPPSVHEFQPDHATGKLLGRMAAELGPDRYKRLLQIIVGGIVILIMATMVINGYYKAKRPALLADCMGRARMLGQAIEMYTMDNERPPLADNWRYGLSHYCDQVGGMDEAAKDAGRRMKARGFSSPMRCLGNQSATPISFFYLERSEMRLRNAVAPITTMLPLLVDEVHHLKVVVLREDISAVSISTPPSRMRVDCSR